MQDMLHFTRYMFKKKTGQKFIVGDHHKIICEALDKVIRGEIKKLIINIAPRYSKTEIVVKNFVSYGLAINHKAKFIHLSYSDDLVLDNSREIQDMINADYYQALFPVIPTSRNAKKWYTPEGGGLYAVSTGGQVTGFGAGQVDPEDDKEDEELLLDEFCPYHDSDFAGAIIIDDPIKPDDALSDVAREKVNRRFETTIRNRVNSRNTPIIIIMQRLHENDLSGYLIGLEPDEWTVLSLPCLYVNEAGEECALWPHKHTVEELHALRDKDQYVFDTQYQQNPKPIEGLLYREFRTYEVIPYHKDAVRKNYTDTADTGSDYLCSICYEEHPDFNYITDVLFTKKPMEYTEPKTAEMLTRNKTEQAVIEANNGGRGFGRNVERHMREMGNAKTAIVPFTQTNNKYVRIFTNSASVNNVTLFPVNWKTMWPEFYRHITSYRKENVNGHDDAEDCLTGTFEFRSPIFNLPSDLDKSDLGIY